MVKFSGLNPFRLLNSVPFGIALMALTAIYIAMGSARPWLKDAGIDEWAVFRSGFDQTDLQFFDSWPLKTLMALLVANLIVVTWRKIPLTPPRYGVWCIHAGIITLICGSAMYYHYKVEGRLRVYTDSNAGPSSVDHFYDVDERSLYVRIGDEDPVELPLPGLPRFKEYDDDRYGHFNRLVNCGLSGLEPAIEFTDQNGKRQRDNLAEMMGLKGQKVKIDVVGFYPYAQLQPVDFKEDPKSSVTGIEAWYQSAANQPTTSDWWLVGSDPELRATSSHANMDLVHRQADERTVDELIDAVGKLFHLDVVIANQPAIGLDVQVGKTYEVGKTGYTLAIESYQPSWSMFGTNEQTPMLQMKVTSPQQTYRRMVLQDQPVQTDFKLDDASAGPLGARQQTPLDTSLRIDFKVHDPFQLLPTQNFIRHTLLTTAVNGEVVDLTTGTGDVAPQVHRCPGGVEDIPVTEAHNPMNAPAAANTTQPVDPSTLGRVHIQRHDHLKRVDTIKIIPPAFRDKTKENDGDYQIVKLRVSVGNWSTITYAPFADNAADHLQTDIWQGGFVFPPDAIGNLRMQLGNARKPLPARLTLMGFKTIPYDGAAPTDPNPMMKDFVSTIRLTDNDTGASPIDEARMNHPVYYDYHGNSWLFFQQSFGSTPEGHQYTQLGVGNRPAVHIMWAGFIMIVIGLAYAFYAKPIIIRRMKQNAIDRALASGKTVRTINEDQPVGSL